MIIVLSLPFIGELRDPHFVFSQDQRDWKCLPSPLPAGSLVASLPNQALVAPLAQGAPGPCATSVATDLSPPEEGNRFLLPRWGLCWGCCLNISVSITIAIAIIVIIIIVIIVPYCNEHCVISLQHASATLLLVSSPNYLGSPDSELFKQSPRTS